MECNFCYRLHAQVLVLQPSLSMCVCFACFGECVLFQVPRQIPGDMAAELEESVPGIDDDDVGVTANPDVCLDVDGLEVRRESPREGDEDAPVSKILIDVLV